MAAPDFSDVSKTSDTKAFPIPSFSAPKMSIPAFSDIAKPSNDLINKDFYHAAAAALEVKLKTPDGVNFTAKGTSSHDGPISSSVEAKKAVQNGISITQSWNTANVLNTKVELVDSFTKDLKVEVLNNFSPAAGNKGQKLNVYFKQPQFHTRAFLDYAPSGKVSALADIVIGHEGFLVGGEAGYDVQKAALSKWSAAVGYSTPTYTAAVTATNSFNIFAASYYHRVNKSVEAGTKATYDAKTGKSVGIEIASKYKIDPLSFAKAKINDRGIASLAYNTKINSGLTFGIGGSFDTQKFNEAGHKFGTTFTFEG